LVTAALLATGLWVIAVGSWAEQPVEQSLPLPFSSGEQLEYDISWLYMKAGTAVMAVEGAPAVDGRPAFKFVTVAQSGPLVTKFYPVANRAESLVDIETFLPRWMSFRRREGKRQNDFEYTFHHQEHTVTAVKDGTTDQLDIPGDAQDAVSCLYFVRKMLPMTPGASLALNVHHDKKNYKLRVQVEAVELVKGPWGTIQAARVLAIMPFQGIFLNEGNVRVWFTVDERRIPVRMKAKVIIGSIVADLVRGFDRT
jgi:hypothetical protein